MSKTNSGHCNSGNHNSGHHNSGNHNSGHHNSGHCNSGNGNSRNCNSGNGNSGYYNAGDRNSGNHNSGHNNVGDRNSGNHNFGDRNSGNGNSGNGNSGWFNTTEPTLRLFNKDSALTIDEFYDSPNYPDLESFSLTKWVPATDMTDAEKQQHPQAVTTGGYLKVLDYKEAWRVFWAGLAQSERQRFLNLPNFDAAIFAEITGINVQTPSTVVPAQEIVLDGRRYRLVPLD